MGQVSIEDVRVGDWVYARDADGQIVLRQVTDEIVTEGAAQLFLTIEHEEGRVETLATTDEHPFWVEDGRGFVRADELSPGDVLKAATGESIVRGLSISGERTAVYNLTVYDVHTYLVGPDGVWVHNCGLTPFPQSGVWQGNLGDLVRHRADVRVNGTTLQLDNLWIEGELGNAAYIQLLDKTLDQARQQGFRRLEIFAVRSSGAAPGTIIQSSFDL